GRGGLHGRRPIADVRGQRHGGLRRVFRRLSIRAAPSASAWNRRSAPSVRFAGLVPWNRNQPVGSPLSACDDESDVNGLKKGVAESRHGCRWTFMDTASLPDAEAGKDLAQQVVAGEPAGYPAQVVVRQAQFFGEQVQHAIVLAGVRGGGGEMGGG